MIIDLNKIFLLLAAARIIRANEMRVKWRNPVTDSPAPTPLPYYICDPYRQICGNGDPNKITKCRINALH
ncbi:hypothetical protein COCVIDRAFT_28188 [Bipolaris victoriae FI3]|uniref:Uncharacterized protein n=1 Tax=Bipolaris victoriae (strain FI3) TaxID=930091 RepID=W7EHE5_BIPV3|nr:hypothetical protein COCVIDRAFT_28188 [Bipolaris victoriae FI3]